MSVLFHPSLGRFTDPDEVHAGGFASGTDSDVALSHYRRRAGLEPRARREESAHLQGAPGSRRHRRFLNATMSESEYDTEASWDSDEDRPIVRFEWRSDFVQVGTDFFASAHAEKVRAERADPSRRRRLPKMHRRMRGDLAAVTQDDGTLSDEEEDDAVLVESQPALARRQKRAAKFAHGYDARQAAAVSTSDSEANMSDAAAATPAQVQSSSSATPATIAVGLQRLTIAEAAAQKQRRLPGQEYAASLFLQVEHSVRTALRKASSHHEHHFLNELETLLVAFKHGVHRDTQHIYTTFDLQPYEVSPPTSATLRVQEGAETEATSDDDMLMVNAGNQRIPPHKKPPHLKRHTSGDDAPLVLTFHNAYERFLAHGVAQYHNLVAMSVTDPKTGLRMTEIRIPSKGVRLHQAKLVPYLVKIQSVYEPHSNLAAATQHNLVGVPKKTLRRQFVEESEW